MQELSRKALEKKMAKKRDTQPDGTEEPTKVDRNLREKGSAEVSYYTDKAYEATLAQLRQLPLDKLKTLRKTSKTDAALGQVIEDLEGENTPAGEDEDIDMLLNQEENTGKKSKTTKVYEQLRLPC